MANKNTKRRQAIARAGRQSFTGTTISRSQRRNSQMVTIGGVTRHVPLDASQPMSPKGHHHMEGTYRGKISPNGTAKPAHEAPAEGFEFNNSVIHV